MIWKAVSTDVTGWLWLTHWVSKWNPRVNDFHLISSSAMPSQPWMATTGWGRQNRLKPIVIHLGQVSWYPVLLLYYQTTAPEGKDQRNQHLQSALQWSNAAMHAEVDQFIRWTMPCTRVVQTLPAQPFQFSPCIQIIQSQPCDYSTTVVRAHNCCRYKITTRPERPWRCNCTNNWHCSRQAVTNKIHRERIQSFRHRAQIIRTDDSLIQNLWRPWIWFSSIQDLDFWRVKWRPCLTCTVQNKETLMWSTHRPICIHTLSHALTHLLLFCNSLISKKKKCLVAALLFLMNLIVQ